MKTEAWPIAQRKKLAMNEHLFCVGVQGDLGVGNYLKSDDRGLGNWPLNPDLIRKEHNFHAIHHLTSDT